MISDKGLYGMLSGVITTAILQPFENIKIALMLPPSNLKLSSNFLTNILRSTSYIKSNDGWLGFYKGISAATIKAALGCYIYFSFLRYLEKDNQSASKNFIVSFIARISSTFLTNPFSIIETRFQLAGFHQYTSINSAIRNIYSKQGFNAFFNGGLASCLKQGLFSGLYYMIYQELKNYGLSRVYSGLFAGILSTTITHPFEIIRARLQTIGLTQKHQLSQHLIFRQICILKQNNTWFKGLAPRIIKKPLANTLTFLIFQIMEEQKQLNRNQ